MPSYGLDMLGTESREIARPVSWSSTAIATGVGIVGAVAWRKHPVLGFLGASALASNVHAVVAGDRIWKDAGRRIGKHVMAVAGALAMPKHPAVGYVAGAVAGELLIDGDGGGIVEEWAHYAGVREAPQKVEIVDVTPKSQVRA
jgi:hypothetical protein